MLTAWSTAGIVGPVIVNYLHDTRVAEGDAERALQNEAVRGPDGQVIEYRYNGAVANRALELLGREIGMFIERHEHGGPGDFERMSDDELRQLAYRAIGATARS